MHSSWVAAAAYFSSEQAMVEPLAPFALAERVAEAARGLGIETALIGAGALAAHNYVRGTNDIDLASVVDPRTELRNLELAILNLGFHAELRMPDDEDPLGGVLRIWQVASADGEPIEPIEIVNFYNPFRPRLNPAADAIRNAVRLDDHSALRYVRLPDLIALKLYAGGRRDLADIVELMVNNSDADLDEIRVAAKPYDPEARLDELITEAAARRG
jgi:hypothetical protein